jgi:hypothetical protein
MPTALEAIARLRTMRAFLTGEDRTRFEQLVADVEQAVWEGEGVTADLARVIANGIGEAMPAPLQPLELTDVIAGALRGIDSVLASRAVTVDIDAAPAVFVLGDAERLEHLFAVALAIAASAVPARGCARICYGTTPEGVAVTIAPYRNRDPRTVIVAALAQSQGAAVEGDDAALTLRLNAAVAAPV